MPFDKVLKRLLTQSFTKFSGNGASESCFELIVTHEVVIVKNQIEAPIDEPSFRLVQPNLNFKSTVEVGCHDGIKGVCLPGLGEAYSKNQRKGSQGGQGSV